MNVRRTMLPVLVVGLLLGPAAQAQASPRISDETLQARAAFCVPCGIAAAALAVRIAGALRAARAARLLAAAGAVLKPLRTGVAITLPRLRILRTQATIVAARGAAWTRQNWPRLTPYLRACIAGVAALETTRILDDGFMTKEEWRGYLSIQTLGKLNTNLLDLYFHPEFNFRVPTDGWYAACAAGIVAKGIGG